MDELEQAVLAASDGGGPKRTWQIPESAAVDLGSGRHPFDGMTVTAWVDSFDAADVAAGRSE